MLGESACNTELLGRYHEAGFSGGGERRARGNDGIGTATTGLLRRQGTQADVFRHVRWSARQEKKQNGS